MARVVGMASGLIVLILHQVLRASVKCYRENTYTVMGMSLVRNRASLTGRREGASRSCYARKGYKQSMRKVLVIAQYLPPAGGVGTFRATKFIKYLRGFGWEPVVLTVCKDSYPKNLWLDRSLENDLPPDANVHRTRVWHSRIINDEGIRWLPYLLPAAVRIIRKERPEAIYITGGPFFPLIAGPITKRLFRLPYVIDLRDPWKTARRGSKRVGLRALIGELLTGIVEPWVIRGASRVICVSQTMCAEYRELYPRLSENKFVVITNGYDPDDFEGIAPVLLDSPTIVYAGKFRTSEAFRNPVSFFRALKLLTDRGQRINLLHIGREECEVSKLAEQEGVADLMVHIGPLGYTETLAYSLGADVLLLIGGGQLTEQTGKVFDYLGCKKPVLALAPKNGGIAGVLGAVPNAVVLDEADPETIAANLDDLCFGPWQPRDVATVSYPDYQRRYLASLLSEVLDEALRVARDKLR